ncbi:hypothetical protein [uncultured Clostridium sp.]|uniref:phage tail protein n=1 Tax=uncultured Clostridium sp. TaxID=59620 RepID=UPI002617DC6A|nr:hypothetical protein [uncultured Clostridium sp.]
MDLSAIKINVKADTKEANSSLKDLQKTGENFTKVGKGLAVGLTLPLALFGAASVKAADSLRQTQRKTEVIFGDMAKDVQKWSLENERTFGLGAGTIEGYTGKIADLTQGMGLGKKESFEMGKGAMELGVQLANWNGVGADVAMTDLTAAIGGSHKAMEKYGVKLNQTVLDEQTRKMGLGDTFNKLSEAEKAQVRYNAIIGASGNAIEFWNEGNRSTAFYMSEIKEQIGNVMEVLGGLFLPILDKVIKVVADGTAKFAAFVSENEWVAKAIVGVGAALASLGPGLLIAGKLMTLCAKFTFLIPVFAGVAAGVAALGISFIGTNENAQKFITELPAKLIGGLNSMLASITEKLPQMTAKGLEIVNNFITGLVNGLPLVINFAGEMLIGLLDTFFTYMPTFLQTGMDFIMNVLNGLVIAAPQLINGAVNAVVDLLFKLWAKMPEFLQTGFDFVKNMLDGFIQKFPQLLQNMIDGVLKILANIRAKLPEFLKNGLEFVAKMIAGVAQNMPKIISKMGELIGQLIATIVKNLPKFLAEGAKIVAELVKGLWNNKGKLVEIGGNLIKALWNSCVAGVGAFLNIGFKIVESIKNGIANAWGSLTSWLGSKIKNIPIIGGLFGSIAPEEGLVDNPVPTSFAQLTRTPFTQLNKDLTLPNFVARNRELNLLKNTASEKQQEVKKEINITIENFVNNTKEDVNDLMEKIAFEMQRRQLC